MGFSTVFSGIASDMITKAAGFIGDFSPILAGVVGIAFAGYALMVLRRFVS